MVKSKNLNEDFAILWSKVLLDDDEILKDDFVVALGCLAELGQINALQSFVQLERMYNMFVDGSVGRLHPALNKAVQTQIGKALERQDTDPEANYLSRLVYGSDGIDYTLYRKAIQSTKDPFLAERFLELCNIRGIYVEDQMRYESIVRVSYMKNPDILNSFSYAKYLHYVYQASELEALSDDKLRYLEIMTILQRLSKGKFSPELQKLIEERTPKKQGKGDDEFPGGVYSVPYEKLGF